MLYQCVVKKYDHEYMTAVQRIHDGPTNWHDMLGFKHTMLTVQNWILLSAPHKRLCYRRFGVVVEQY